MQCQVSYQRLIGRHYAEGACSMRVVAGGTSYTSTGTFLMICWMDLGKDFPKGLMLLPTERFAWADLLAWACSLCSLATKEAACATSASIISFRKLALPMPHMTGMRCRPSRCSVVSRSPCKQKSAFLSATRHAAAVGLGWHRKVCQKTWKSQKAEDAARLCSKRQALHSTILHQ